MSISSATDQTSQQAADTAGEWFTVDDVNAWRVTLSWQDVAIMLTCVHNVRQRAEPKYAEKLGLLIERVQGVM